MSKSRHENTYIHRMLLPEYCFRSKLYLLSDFEWQLAVCGSKGRTMQNLALKKLYLNSQPRQRLLASLKTRVNFRRLENLLSPQLLYLSAVVVNIRRTEQLNVIITCSCLQADPYTYCTVLFGFVFLVNVCMYHCIACISCIDLYIR